MREPYDGPLFEYLVIVFPCPRLLGVAKKDDNKILSRDHMEFSADSGRCADRRLDIGAVGV